MADELPPIDSDSIGHLEDVKRGKSRKFVLICKGAQVVSIAIFRKGNLPSYIKQAKKVGGGHVYHGIVDGKGLEISFKLARADGFETPPTKTQRLKEFLADNTPFKFKPLFEIVETRTLVFDEDNPLAARFLQRRDVAVAACDAHPERAAEINSLCLQIGSHLDTDEGQLAEPLLQELEELLESLPPLVGTPPADSESSSSTTEQAADNEATTLAHQLKALKPSIDKAIDADPRRKGELHATLAQIAGEIKQQQFEQAQQNLAAFATRLAALARQDAVPPSLQGSEAAARFAARRSVLESRLREAQRADREKATRLGAVWDYAIQQAEAANFSNALTALDRLDGAIDAVLGDFANAAVDQVESTLPDNATEAERLKAKWLASRGKAEPLAQAALEANPFGDQEQLAQFRTAWERAVSLGQDGAYDQAIAALQHALNLRKQARSRAGSAVGVEINPEVKPLAEANIRWRNARNVMFAELRKLQDAILQVCASFKSLPDVGNAVAGLVRHLAQVDERLQDKLDEIVNAAAGPKREELKVEAQRILGEYEKQLQLDFFRVVDNQNGFAKVSVAATLKSALTDIARVLS